MKLVSLNRWRERRVRMERDRVRAQLVHDARSVKQEIDGYAIVTYRHIRDAEGTVVRTRALYCCRDTVDAHRLPELARSCIQRLVDGNFEPVPPGAGA